MTYVIIDVMILRLASKPSLAVDMFFWCLLINIDGVCNIWNESRSPRPQRPCQISPPLLTPQFGRHPHLVAFE